MQIINACINDMGIEDDWLYLVNAKPNHIVYASKIYVDVLCAPFS